MKYRTFGKTGLEISVLGFGCMRLPVIDGDHTRIDEDEAAEMVRYAIDRGVNYFDTAYPYHAESFAVAGSSEPFLASAREAGKIRYAGFSFHDDLDLFRAIVDAYDWDVCQIMYNDYDEHFQAGKVSDAPWTDRDKSVIEKIGQVIQRLQKVNCTACGYCMPCPEGVDIPRNFSFCNDHHMLKDPSAKTRYRGLLSESEKASNCIQCGLCEEKCPQQIPIMDELKYVSELFET